MLILKKLRKLENVSSTICCNSVMFCSAKWTLTDCFLLKWTQLLLKTFIAFRPPYELVSGSSNHEISWPNHFKKCCQRDSPWPNKNPSPLRLRRSDCYGNTPMNRTRNRNFKPWRHSFFIYLCIYMSMFLSKKTLIFKFFLNFKSTTNQLYFRKQQREHVKCYITPM